MNKLKFANLSISLQEIPDSKVGEIVEQFMRDVNKCSCSIKFDLKKGANILELKEFIFFYLKKISIENEEMLWQLLYLIDLPEDLLNQIMKSEDRFENLSKLVLIREWQKVFIRQNYSAK